MAGKALWIAAVAGALSACAPLTAEAPLFSPADQIGPAPLAEGVWITVSEDCPARNARRRGRLPRKCLPAELRRLPDGAWLYRYQDHVPMKGEEGESEMPRSWRLVIAPATERQPTDSFVPLYLAEYSPLEEAGWTGPHYAAIAPIGQMPAREFAILLELDCGDILRDGPIEGIAANTNARGDMERCVASNQAAAREAVRRATIENLSEMINETEGERFVFVRQ